MKRIRIITAIAACALVAMSSPSAAQLAAAAGATADTTVVAGPVKPAAGRMVEAGSGTIKLTGLLQAWYVAGQGLDNTFRVRTAELTLAGQLTPQARWTLKLDVAKALSLRTSYTTVGEDRVVSGGSVNQGSRMLQDAFMTLDVGRGVSVDVGQFKLPLGLEHDHAPSRLLTVERALFLSDRGRGGLGVVRDVGASVRGRIASVAEYRVGVHNGLGESANTTDADAGKTLTARAVLAVPGATGLRIGASGARDVGGDTAGAPREWLGADASWTRGPLGLAAETMLGHDAGTPRLGYYLHGDYRIAPALQVVLRYDAWDPDTRRDTAALDARQHDYLVGVNWYLTGNHVKLQGNYVRKSFDGIVPSRDMVLVNLQMSW